MRLSGGIGQESGRLHAISLERIDICSIYYAP